MGDYPYIYGSINRMITTHRIGEIQLDDSYGLIAIHSGMEGYKLGYELNRVLHTRFHREKTDLELPGGLHFPVFLWEDELNDRTWTLFYNECRTMDQDSEANLFSDEKAFSVHYLVPERKEVDYFLKIEQDYEQVAIDVLKQIKGMPGIITAYTVQEDVIKSKLNYIY